jgi:hypothetical protein
VSDDSKKALRGAIAELWWAVEKMDPSTPGLNAVLDAFDKLETTYKEVK